MVGDVKLHHALAQLVQALILGRDLDAGGHRRGARRRCSLAAFDFHKTQAAGAEGLDRVSGAELWNLGAKLHGGPHDRRAFRHRDLMAINFQCHHLGGLGDGRAEIQFFDQHGITSALKRDYQ